MTTIKWRVMNKGDLADICEIAAICHPNYPEDEAVLAQKQKLSPQTCYLLEQNHKPSGYILAHPWALDNIPPLNQFLPTSQLVGEFGKDTNTLYLHDIALLPAARQSGVGALGLKLLYKQAKNLGFDKVALVAVNHSSSFWIGQGFVMQKVTPSLQKKLLTYDADAAYMLKNL